jgi:hypothetical protein
MEMFCPVNPITVPWEIFFQIPGIQSGIMICQCNCEKEKIFLKNVINASLFRNVVGAAPYHNPQFKPCFS